MNRSLLYILAALTVIGCHSGHEHEHEHEHEHAHAEEAHGSDEIVFDEHRQERFGIETETIVLSTFNSTIHAGGRFLPAQGDDIVVVAPSNGTVSLGSSSLSQGSRIAAGSTIASISASAIAGGDPLVKAKAAYDAAMAEYLRDSAMVRDNVVAASHFEQSKAAYIQAKAEYDALAGRSAAGGVSVKAPKSGYLRSLAVSAGQYVEAGQAIAVISQGSRLSLQVEVPERYASRLSGIVDANFSVPSGEILSVKALGGRILSRSHSAEDGYFTVTFEVPDKGSIVPGAFAESWLVCSSQAQTVTVPLAAVIEEQGVYSVFIQLDEDCFQKREVVLGANDGVRAEVRSGLEIGETIVSKGAMHIKLASVSAVPSGHNHQH